MLHEFIVSLKLIHKGENGDDNLEDEVKGAFIYEDDWDIPPFVLENKLKNIFTDCIRRLNISDGI